MRFWPLRMALAHYFAALMLAFFVTATAALAGWAYGSRNKVCAQIPQRGALIVVCDYGYEPPEGSFVQ